VDDFFAWDKSVQFVERSADEKFRAMVAKSETELRNRMSSYQQALIGGVGLYAGSKNVNYLEWQACLESFNIHCSWPACTGFDPP